MARPRNDVEELTDAIDALREATSKRRHVAPGTTGHGEALATEERMNRRVMDLARRLSRPALVDGSRS
jgi:predicted metal-dependent TIM-barrel fold hydrolase